MIATVNVIVKDCFSKFYIRVFSICTYKLLAELTYICVRILISDEIFRDRIYVTIPQLCNHISHLTFYNSDELESRSSRNFPEIRKQNRALAELKFSSFGKIK